MRSAQVVAGRQPILGGMVLASERRVRGWPLTRRLVVALSIGALFVAVLLGMLGADRDDQQLARAQAEAEQRLAESLAERAGPLLDRADVMRLSVLAAVVRDLAGGRALILDRSGTVVIDTALVMGDRRLALLANAAPFQRMTEIADGVPLRESLVPVRFGGEVIGEVRLQCEPRAARAGFDLTWFGLVLLSCLSLVVVAGMLAHYWSVRVRSATDAVIRIAAGEVAGSAPPVGECELQDLQAALRELERGMTDGLQRVGDGYVAMALHVIEGLEQRRLIPAGRGERTARLAARLAERLKLLPADRNELDLACRLVDLGKAWVRASILQKQGPLTSAEAQSLEHHPVRAAEQLECVPAMRRIAKILRHQLERYDGRGTPDGLRGDRIPLGSRVLAIASTFDLLTTCAPERALDPEQALQQLLRSRGEVFDPWLVDLFAEEIRKDPPLAAADRDVMIVPAGAFPWRNPAAEVDDDDDDCAEVHSELELMHDDHRFEEP